MVEGAPLLRSIRQKRIVGSNPIFSAILLQATVLPRTTIFLFAVDITMIFYSGRCQILLCHPLQSFRRMVGDYCSPSIGCGKIAG